MVHINKLFSMNQTITSIDLTSTYSFIVVVVVVTLLSSSLLSPADNLVEFGNLVALLEVLKDNKSIIRLDLTRM